MPVQIRIGRLRNFLQGFLDLVFAEVPLPGLGRGANGVDGMGLGNGDQANIAGLAAAPAGRVRDPLAHARQPLRVLLRTLRYFLSCATIPFACVANCPSGASFK